MQNTNEKLIFFDDATGTAADNDDDSKGWFILSTTELESKNKQDQNLKYNNNNNKIKIYILY